MGDASREFEEKRLSETVAFIDGEIDRLGNLQKSNIQTAMKTGRKFADDSPYGAVYPDQGYYTLQEDLGREIASYEQAKTDCAMLKRLKLNPYFARIDFKRENSSSENIYYIGLKNLIDKNTHKTLVCDWRAPVAELFYNDFEKIGYFDAPIGRISGEILLNRQYKFENGVLTRYFDTDMKINDEILQVVLSQESQDKLKVIVNSIQKEQNTAIRYSSNENIIIFGPAGSGKTSIGLHRVAYLLYHNRHNLQSREIMLFTNSNIFSSYIADIIPELGENDIVKTDFFDIILANFDSQFKIYDYYEMSNNLLSKNNAQRKSEIKIKFSNEFIRYIEENTVINAFECKDITVFGHEIMNKEEILHRFTGDTEFNHAQKIERIISICTDEIEHYFVQNQALIMSEIEAVADPVDDFKEIYRSCRRRTKHQAKIDLYSSFAINEIRLYQRFLKSYCIDNSCTEIYKRTASLLNENKVKYEDALAVLYIKILLGTIKKFKQPKHILIDEAQDICALQHKIITKICDKSKFTLLADINQGVLPEINMTSKEELLNIYGARAINLSKSFRSTRQINEVALRLLQGEKYDIFEREGEKVEFLEGMDSAKAILSLIESGKLRGKSTCIVTKSISQAQNLYAQLYEKNKKIKLLDDRSEEFSDGIMVVPLIFTKGLEFDNVIIADADKLCENLEENRRILYLMVTRALHRLFVIFKEKAPYNALNHD